jgi:hypothetical protein
VVENMVSHINDSIIGSLVIDNSISNNYGLKILKLKEQNISTKCNTEIIDFTEQNNILCSKTSIGTKLNENFHNEIIERCKITKNNDQISAQILSDSLVYTADSINDIFGQAQANAFMSIVLAATDGGVNESTLMSAISSFFKEIHSNADEKQLFDMMNVLNSVLDAIFEKDNDIISQVASGTKYGLGFALNKFFNKEINFFGTDKIMVETNSFDLNLELVQMTIVKPNDNVECWVKVNTGRYETAGALVGSETIMKIASYLNENIGNDNTAFFLENLNTDANVMDAIATSISMVIKENGQESANKYVDFLNSNISSVISSITNNISFNGWTIGSDYSEIDVQYEKSNGNLKIGTKIGDLIRSKSHQALGISWTDQSSGVTTKREIDLTDLYNQYLNDDITISSEDHANSTIVSFKKHLGNLINTII